MGVSTNGILCFGFSITEEDEQPEFLENVVSHWGEGEQPELSDLIYHEAGILPPHDNETEEQSSARWKVQREAEKVYPVDLVHHCSGDYPMYILVPREVPHFSASRGGPIGINLVAAAYSVTPEVLGKFQAWCEAHDVEWQEPEWLLCSYWG